MTAPAVLDLDALLAPIAEDRPGGANPRDDASANSLYFRVKDARNAARAAERMAVDVDAPVPDAWNTVIDAATDLLARQAKDLEAAAWLTEALVRVEGFAGLRDGLTLITRLVETFWDHLYPEPDEDGIETKVSPVSGLSGAGATGTLAQPIRMTPLTSGSTAAYALWHYEQAVELEKVTNADRRQARIDAGAVTMEQFRQTVAETPGENIRLTLLTVEECLAALKAMSDAFDRVAGPDAPPTSALRDLLDQVAGSLRHFAGDKLAFAAAAAAPVYEAVPADGESPGMAESRGSAGGALRVDGFASREEALEVLSRIAGYFRRTEPQSPISYTLEEAVRRARMSLPELLQELTQDPAHKKHILLAAGIKVPDDSAEQPSTFY